MLHQLIGFHELVASEQKAVGYVDKDIIHSFALLPFVQLTTRSFQIFKNKAREQEDRSTTALKAFRSLARSGIFDFEFRVLGI